MTATLTTRRERWNETCRKRREEQRHADYAARQAAYAAEQERERIAGIVAAADDTPERNPRQMKWSEHQMDWTWAFISRPEFTKEATT